MSWIGGSVIPKLESSKDMYIHRDKYVANFTSYDKHFEESKAEGIASMKQAILQQKKAAQKAQQELNEKDQPTKIAETLPVLE